MEHTSIAVIGGGTIGSSWARLFAGAGAHVAVYDPAPTVRARVEALAAERVTVHADLKEALHGATYVQECVAEDLSLKRSVFADLDRQTGDTVVLASSTSAIPMSRIAADLRSPSRCLVAHPTNPPHVVPLVELVGAPFTDPEVVQQTRRFLSRVGMEPIVCHREIEGFVLNRLQAALQREALHLAIEGIASPADIDLTVTQGLALRWAFLGPLALEETQGPGLEEYMGPGGAAAYFDHIFTVLAGPLLVDDEAIKVMRSAVDAAAAGRSHAELLAYRDRSVAALRELKRSQLG